MNPMNYAWVVMKRGQPEDEDTYEGAWYCEKCNRKLRAGDVDTHMCNRCIRQDEGGSFPPIPPVDKDLNKLLKQFKRMAEMMKKMSKGNLKGISDKGIPPELFNQL